MLKNKHIKWRIAMNPPQNTSPCFKNSYPFIPDTLSQLRAPCWPVSLSALLGPPYCPEPIQLVNALWSFGVVEEPEVTRCPIPWLRWLRMRVLVLQTCLPLRTWHSEAEFSASFSEAPMREGFQHWFSKWLMWGGAFWEGLMIMSFTRKTSFLIEAVTGYYDHISYLP